MVVGSTHVYVDEPYEHMYGDLHAVPYELDEVLSMQQRWPLSPHAAQVYCVVVLDVVARQRVPAPPQ